MISYNELPQAVSELHEKVDRLIKLLLVKSQETQTHVDELLTVQQAATFLCLKVPTIYGLISRGELPVVRGSKRRYFFKEDLVDYLKASRQESMKEIAIEADTYLNRKSKKH